MSKKDEAPEFAPEQWVTVRDTGEHVKVELWSPIAGAYRVRSKKHGLQFVGKNDLVTLCVHPEAHRGKGWHRCQAPGCGAPLTPNLDTCEKCESPICSCGRCRCSGTRRK